MTVAQQTLQVQEWRGEFGRQYTRRNSLTPEEVDALWQKNYGITRRKLNRRFLAGIPRGSRILEVGCNIGNHPWPLISLCRGQLSGRQLRTGLSNRVAGAGITFLLRRTR